MFGMRKIPVIMILLVAFSLLVTTSTRANEPTSTLVTRLQMRNKTILIKNNGDGLKYSVKAEDGTVLNANLTEAELASKYPDLYETVRPSIAFPDSSPGIWAGM